MSAPDVLRAALELIASGCERYLRGYCGERNGDKVLNLRWSADAWCDPCIARAALDDDWPVVIDGDGWGFIDTSGTTWLAPSEQAARDGAERHGGAVVRKTADGRLVAA